MLIAIEAYFDAIAANTTSDEETAVWLLSKYLHHVPFTFCQPSAGV
jgi:hypothetical protein